MDRSAELLRRQVRWKSTPAYTPPLLGEQAVELFNKQIKRRHERFGAIGSAWTTLVPAYFQDHTFMASFTKGVLTIHVDSSAHLYELRNLMLAGLEQQLKLAAAGAGLRQIKLKRGPLEAPLPEPD